MNKKEIWCKTIRGFI